MATLELQRLALRRPLQLLQSSFSGSFATERVCFPSMFLIGFPKCGSTYVWCFIRALVRIAASVGIHSPTEIAKEPHFWVKGAANTSRCISQPNANQNALFSILVLLHIGKDKSSTCVSSTIFLKYDIV